MELSKNRILMAVIASQKDKGSFVPDGLEYYVARADIGANLGNPALADIYLEGVNTGLYYAHMFGIPQRVSRRELSNTLSDRQARLEELASDALNAADTSRRLLEDN